MTNERKRSCQSFGILHSSFVLFSLLAITAQADTIVLTNGQTVTGKTFHLKADAIVATAETPGPDGKMMSVERSIPLKDIAKVECEQPAVFQTVRPLLSVGKAAAALPDIIAAVKAAEPFGELEGSLWPDLIVLQTHALLALGKDAEAAALLSSFDKTVHAEIQRDSKAIRAILAARKGDHATALPLAMPLLKESTKTSTIAAASYARGLSLLAKKQYQDALKAFLELPVFTPDDVVLSTAAYLGTAQAYYGLEDYDRAIATLEDLIKNRADSFEVSVAQSLLPEWTRRRKVINEAKEP